MFIFLYIFQIQQISKQAGFFQLSIRFTFENSYKHVNETQGKNGIYWLKQLHLFLKGQTYTTHY